MTDRREFLKKLGMAAIGAAILPPWEGFAKPAPEADKLNVALIGVKNMGFTNLSDFLKTGRVKCGALCDVDANLLDWRGSQLRKMGVERFKTYADYRYILDRKDIDAVIIGTPDHWHCLQMAHAVQSGKHVYIEKPLANSIAECETMEQFAKRYGKVVQVGQQQRSGNHWIRLKEFLDSGRLGHISRVNVWANFEYVNLSPGKQTGQRRPPSGVDYDLWLGPAPLRDFNPLRFHGTWRMFWDYGGGLMTDWGVHLLDIALWGMGIESLPSRVFATGGNHAFPDNLAETFDTMSVVYEYPGLTIQWNNTAFKSGPYNKNYGIEFVGKNGTLVADRQGWEVFPCKQRMIPVSMKSDNLDHITHVRNFIDCITGDSKELACGIEAGSLCAKMAHLGNISARTGKVLSYDGSHRSFSDAEADKLLKPEYRNNYSYPTL